jgi:hypothetical protein
MNITNHKKRSRKSEKDWHWAYSVIIAGLFVGILSIAIVTQQTFITKTEVSKFLAFFCFVWFIIPINLYCKWLKLEKLEAFLLGIVGVGPLIFSGLLWTNYLVIKEVHKITYNVVEIVPESYNIVGGGLTSVLYELEFDSMWDFPEFRRFEFTGEMSILKTTAVKYSFGKGVLGYDVIEDRELVIK